MVDSTHGQQSKGQKETEKLDMQGLDCREKVQRELLSYLFLLAGLDSR